MTTKNKLLQMVKEKYFAHGEIEESKELMIDWIKDLREIDGVADWAWKVLNHL